jgi:hypothetical protein
MAEDTYQFQSVEEFDELVDWIIREMAVGVAEPPYAPEPAWLLEQARQCEYDENLPAMKTLADIVAGNGYRYI